MEGATPFAVTYFLYTYFCRPSCRSGGCIGLRKPKQSPKAVRIWLCCYTCGLHNHYLRGEL